jgi:hypothetical protein
MRSALVVLLVLGCSSQPAPVAPSNHTAAPPAKAPPALGTTGFPGVDWTATEAAIEAAYPGAVYADPVVTVNGQFEGRAAQIRFSFHAPGRALGSITVDFPDVFTSMDDCGETWAVVRTRLDARLGRSENDNLEATWYPPDATIMLVCDPLPDGHVALSVSYTPADNHHER